MATFTLYLESMQALSVGLGKAMLLVQLRKEIKKEYARIPAAPNNDSKALVEAIIQVMPRIEQLRNKEKALHKEYVEALNNSIDRALEFILSFEKGDMEEPIIAGFQKHLDLLHKVIMSHYSSGEEKITINQDQKAKVINLLDTFTDEPQSLAVRQAILQVDNDIKQLYVG